jgi:hypothetical protein
LKLAAPKRPARARTLAATCVAALLALGASSCNPKAPPLVGAVVPARIPRAALPPVHRTIIFEWSYRDPDLQARGEGAARVAPPDSVRIDLFLGGVGSTRATLIGHALRVPGGALIRNLLPPPPLLWASLGRLDVPPAPDTVARLDADTLRVDIGRDPRWRSTFIGDSLAGLMLIDGGRQQQWVVRRDSTVHYEHVGGRRTLRLRIVRVDTVPPFDDEIWR